MKKMLISFSGGQTSAYMLQWLLKNKANEFEFQVVFANTGCENNETLCFVQRCSEYFNVPVVWVERTFGPQKFKTTGYEQAVRLSDWRNGSNPMELMVREYGLPNPARPFTTRELKLKPITKYLRSIGWNSGGYSTAIGIRADEFDRMSIHQQRDGIVYPLINWHHTVKADVDAFWKERPFRLGLGNYEGNCVFCYKKSAKKLALLYREQPKCAAFFDYLEEKYAHYLPERLKKHYAKIGKEEPAPPFSMYRNRLTLKELARKTAPADGLFDSCANCETACEIHAGCGWATEELF